MDYKPDISASKKNTWVFVEVEVDETLNSNHTIGQLEKMHKYVVNNSPCSGILVVPGGTRKRAEFLIESIFESKKIKVVGLY